MAKLRAWPRRHGTAAACRGPPASPATVLPSGSPCPKALRASRAAGKAGTAPRPAGRSHQRHRRAQAPAAGVPPARAPGRAGGRRPPTEACRLPAPAAGTSRCPRLGDAAEDTGVGGCPGAPGRAGPRGLPGTRPGAGTGLGGGGRGAELRGSDTSRHGPTPTRPVATDSPRLRAGALRVAPGAAPRLFGCCRERGGRAGTSSAVVMLEESRPWTLQTLCLCFSS